LQNTTGTAWDKTQLDFTTGNLGYDANGNLVMDKAEGIYNSSSPSTDMIAWTVYGKIKSITKANQLIEYTYDASGNRISKAVTTGSNTVTTCYARNAQGNVLSTYLYGDNNENNGKLTQTEINLYGSNRIGILNEHVNVEDGISSSLIVPIVFDGVTAASGQISTFTRRNKFFELSNHLGNVLAVISDRKNSVAKASPNDDEIGYYISDIVSATDYAPFGMTLVGRSFSSDKYRYGFNGKENDNEVKGNGNQLDYGMRIYDPRLGNSYLSTR
jgi:YD repeat-containing protein